MKKVTSSGHHNFAALTESLGNAHTYLKEAYQEKKKEITDGLSFFKDELSGTFEKTGRCIDLVAMPVNNYLKDITQIENEFKAELAKSQEYCICLDGEMVPANEVLSRSMEENY